MAWMVVQGTEVPSRGVLMARKEAVVWIPEASEAHVLKMKAITSKAPWIPLNKTVLIFLSPTLVLVCRGTHFLSAALVCIIWHSGIFFSVQLAMHKKHFSCFHTAFIIKFNRYKNTAQVSYNFLNSPLPSSYRLLPKFSY